VIPPIPEIEAEVFNEDEEAALAPDTADIGRLSCRLPGVSSVRRRRSAARRRALEASSERTGRVTAQSIAQQRVSRVKTSTQARTGPTISTGAGTVALVIMIVLPRLIAGTYICASFRHAPNGNLH
jgi:hypothetical protein